jgi:hypothetical protein
MKTCILFFILLISTASVRAQTLKELLYGGKLKLDTGTVIRKGDDLSSKIDTTTKKPVEPEKAKALPVARDTVMSDGTITTITTPQPDVTATSAAASATATKDNNKVWKDFIDELTGTLRTEVLPSQKIKGGTYSVLIEYEIGLDGQIAVNNVSASPESSFLEQQIKERLTLTAPQLTPLLGTNGKPRKAVKKQILTISK